VCISAYSLITYLPCYYPLHIICFLHLLSTNHKCTQPYYFSPATQTCSSEGEDGPEFFDEGFLAVHCPGCHSCGVMKSSAVLFRLRVIVVLRDNIYVIIILYSQHLIICEHFWSVCVKQLILGHTYNEYLVWHKNRV
jgi:hypothetical protein